jgi:hypothetical protein
MSKRPLRFRQLVAEPLERREMMAGDVSVSIAGGTLIVRGDAQANGIAITQLNADTYVVTGFNDAENAAVRTTVNGELTSQTFSGVRNDINIDMGDGNDIVLMDNRNDTNLANARAITGVPTLTIATSATARDFATTNPDRIDVQRNLLIRLGAGDDDASLAFDASIGRSGGSVIIDGGAGHDDIDILTALARGSVTIRTGDGNDTVDIGTGAKKTDVGVRGHLFADLGSGNDWLSAKRLITSSSLVNSGSGDDNITISRSTANSVTNIRTGSGNDSVSIENSTALSALIAIDSSGHDHFFDLGGNTIKSHTIIGYEDDAEEENEIG